MSTISVGGHPNERIGNQLIFGMDGMGMGMGIIKR